MGEHARDTRGESAQASRQIDVSLPLAWHYIRDIRKRVGEALSDSDSELRNATMMVASELVENAVKYGEDVVGATSILFSCSFDADHVRMVVKNGCTDTHAIRKLEQRIQQIADSPDKEALYMARLEELLEDPTESGKLGLYRVAFEGRFDLNATYSDRVVAVTATRCCR
jgi:hypothetical protein